MFFAWIVSVPTRNPFDVSPGSVCDQLQLGGMTPFTFAIQADRNYCICVQVALWRSKGNLVLPTLCLLFVLCSFHI